MVVPTTAKTFNPSTSRSSPLVGPVYSYNISAIDGQREVNFLHVTSNGELTSLQNVVTITDEHTNYAPKLADKTQNETSPPHTHTHTLHKCPATCQHSTAIQDVPPCPGTWLGSLRQFHLTGCSLSSSQEILPTTDRCSSSETKDPMSSGAVSYRGPCCVAGTSGQNLTPLWFLAAHWTEKLQANSFNASLSNGNRHSTYSHIFQVPKCTKNFMSRNQISRKKNLIHHLIRYRRILYSIFQGK